MQNESVFNAAQTLMQTTCPPEFESKQYNKPEAASWLDALGKHTKMCSSVLRNVLLGGNAMSLKLLSKPKDMVFYASETLFTYKMLAGSSQLEQKNIWEVLGSSGTAAITLAEMSDAFFFGPVASYTADIIGLCQICSQIKPISIFEIGTLRGYTAYHFALNSPATSKVYSLDLPHDQTRTTLKTTLVDEWHINESHQDHRYLFENTPVERKINLLYGDSATFDFSQFFGTIDLFFIDSAHSYEYVRSDTLNALKCCHKGSVIAWHDFGRTGVNGVSKCLEEFARQYSIYRIPGGSLAYMVV